MPLQAEQAFSRARLNASWQKTLARAPRPGPDGISAAQFAAQAETRLEQLHQQLLRGEYQAAAAYRAWIPKEGGGERAVVALSLPDRIVEGALLDALRPIAEPRLHPAAFAYRQGLGALRATQELLRRRDEGLHWVVRGDVRDCFDAVPHSPLLESLRPLLTPTVERTVQSLLTRVVMDRGRASRMTCGVAQGSLLAPLFANWYLRPFDEEVTGAGGALVRYADDFVVAAPDALGAGQLLTVSSTALSQLGLSLNPRKTQVLSFGQGFQFLGFQFQGQSVRVSPARLETFRREVGGLLAAQPPSPTALQSVNDLIRGWRAYFTLGEVAQDFRELDEWLAQEFPHLRSQLAPLCPERSLQATSRTLSSGHLGGYALRPARRGKQVGVKAARVAEVSVQAESQATSVSPAQTDRIARALALAWATELAHLWAYSERPERHAVALLASRYAERLTPQLDLELWKQELDTAIRATYRQYGPAAEHLRRAGLRTLAQEVSGALKQAGLTDPQLSDWLTRLYALALLDTPLPELLTRLQPVTQVLTQWLAEPLSEGHPLTWRGALQREANTLAHCFKRGVAYHPRGWQ